ncbi:Uncharacterised protein [Chlamydia trachomatis]|nr:Uncharacterised protein [Chlamydia trachomatis]
MISFVSDVTEIIPCVGSTCKRFAGRPTLTDLIEMPAFSSACVIADLIAEAAASISTIIPSFTPLLLALLTPITFTSPSLCSATNTLMELVPISKPVKKPSLVIASHPLYLPSFSLLFNNYVWT